MVSQLSASSLANGISQEKEKDFPSIWEIFVRDRYDDLNRAGQLQ
jgi:hypothetical protein